MPQIENQLTAEETNAVRARQAGRNRMVLALLVAAIIGLLALGAWHVGKEMAPRATALPGQNVSSSKAG